MHIRRGSNLLRGGLAFIWFWEGLVPKLLFIASRDVSLVAKIGLGEFAVGAIHLTGAVEILMAPPLWRSGSAYASSAPSRFCSSPPFWWCWAALSPGCLWIHSLPSRKLSRWRLRPRRSSS